MHDKTLAPVDLAETLLFNLNIFKFLDQIDGDYESGDTPTIEIVQRFFSSRYHFAKTEVEGVMPFLRDRTTLMMLTPAFTFASSLSDDYWNQIGFKIEESFELELDDRDDAEVVATQHAVLEVLAYACQNLVNSLCDDRFGATIFHCEDSIFFRTPERQLTFRTANGLGSYIQKFVTALTRAIRENALYRNGNQR